jgi:Icc-related predicted phosphoesterase
MIIVLNRKITPEEFQQAREVYKDYIKTVMDTEKEILAVGGEYHIDCEDVLIKNCGSKQENLYGGGYRVSTKEVEYMALSNFKPALNRTTYEIMDENIRKKLEKLTKRYMRI